jgi:hypothetical protein
MAYLRYNIGYVPKYQWLRFISFSSISQWQYTKRDSESKNKILLLGEENLKIETIMARNLLNAFFHKCPLIATRSLTLASWTSISSEWKKGRLAHMLRANSQTGRSTSPTRRRKTKLFKRHGSKLYRHHLRLVMRKQEPVFTLRAVCLALLDKSGPSFLQTGRKRLAVRHVIAQQVLHTKMTRVGWGFQPECTQCQYVRLSLLPWRWRQYIPFLRNSDNDLPDYTISDPRIKFGLFYLGEMNC